VFRKAALLRHVKLGFRGGSIGACTRVPLAEQRATLQTVTSKQ
jgi:hypothetical protein